MSVYDMGVVLYCVVLNGFVLYCIIDRECLVNTCWGRLIAEMSVCVCMCVI